MSKKKRNKKNKLQRNQIFRGAPAPEVPLRFDMLEEISSNIFKLSPDYREDMQVAVAWVNDEAGMHNLIEEAQPIAQILNATTLPGARQVMAMPDTHAGYGFPIGGVAAFGEDGIVSPGAIGTDINCGVRMLRLGITLDEARQKLPKFMDKLAARLPVAGGGFPFEDGELEKTLVRGSEFVVTELGLGIDEDLTVTEAGGCLPAADPELLSRQAKNRGRDMLGTIGGGNHFAELQVVESVLDKGAAFALGIRPGELVFLMHSGSRGLGHQVCTDYVERCAKHMATEGFTTPDHRLVYARLGSEVANDYLGAMAAAANFAWANRQVMTQVVRQVTRSVYGGKEVSTIYDASHNIAKWEQQVDEKVLVHRKGATRAFGSGNPEIPERYRDIGQPVFVPGSMATASYLLVGSGAEELSLGSVCHGAGRARSRSHARQSTRLEDLLRLMDERGVIVKGASDEGLTEEGPKAYKDVDRVCEIVEEAGLCRRVARVRPLGVIKG